MDGHHLVIWAALAIAFLFLQVSINRDCVAASGSPHAATSATNTSAKPYWRRPGCHVVGHTRTISIPGCVKFNLSTNACRGFCMSFSIPAADDIGPAPTLDRLEKLIGGATDDSPIQNPPRAGGDSASSLGTIKADDRQQSPGNKPGNNNAQERNGAWQLMDMIMEKSKRSGAPTKDVYDLAVPQASPLEPLEDPSRILIHFLAGKDGQTPITGLLGEHGQKRDVISVGQCCNMIETEDVTINLRCGRNETRQLVFKSAKTCECFFCKHV